MIELLIVIASSQYWQDCFSGVKAARDKPMMRCETISTDELRGSLFRRLQGFLFSYQVYYLQRNKADRRKRLLVCLSHDTTACELQVESGQKLSLRNARTSRPVTQHFQYKITESNLTSRQVASYKHSTMSQ